VRERERERERERALNTGSGKVFSTEKREKTDNKLDNGERSVLFKALSNKHSNNGHREAKSTNKQSAEAETNK